MNTLYEVLEVSENASAEVIEKAYKVLVKKYHPDLQSPENRPASEKKMKEINEAYDILGDEAKRRQYDEKLSAQREMEKQQQNQQSQRRQEQPPQYQNMQSNGVNQNTRRPDQVAYKRYEDMQRRRYEEELRRQQEKMQKQMQENMQQEYQNAYYNYLRSLGYKIKETWTWQRTKDLLITLLIIAVICTILWILPPTHKMLVDIYETNPILKIIVNIIVNIVTVLFKTIVALFQNLFMKK